MHSFFFLFCLFVFAIKTAFSAFSFISSTITVVLHCTHFFFISISLFIAAMAVSWNGSTILGINLDNPSSLSISFPFCFHFLQNLVIAYVFGPWYPYHFSSNSLALKDLIFKIRWHLKTSLEIWWHWRAWHSPNLYYLHRENANVTTTSYLLNQ